MLPFSAHFASSLVFVAKIHAGLKLLPFFPRLAFHALQLTVADSMKQVNMATRQVVALSWRENIIGNTMITAGLL